MRFGDAWGLGCLSQFEAQVQHLVVSELTWKKKNGSTVKYKYFFVPSPQTPLPFWFDGFPAFLNCGFGIQGRRGPEPSWDENFEDPERIFKILEGNSKDFHGISSNFEDFRDPERIPVRQQARSLWISLKSYWFLLNSIEIYWIFLIFFDFNENEPKRDIFDFWRTKNPSRKNIFWS